MSSRIARSRSRAASRRWTIARRIRPAPTETSSSHSAGAATRRGRARSRSPTAWPNSLRLDIGSTLALDGRRRTVVGIVENPRKLSDEFALVSPSPASAADYVSVLVDATDESLESFFGRGPDSPPAFAGAQVAGSDNPEAPVLAMFSVTTVFLLLASLVAAAGFAVVAQRRLRHLGMLAAVGATEKQLRLVLLANGAIVGAIAALVGTTVGLAAWFVFGRHSSRQSTIASTGSTFPGG